MSNVNKTIQTEQLSYFPHWKFSLNIKERLTATKAQMVQVSSETTRLKKEKATILLLVIPLRFCHLFCFWTQHAMFLFTWTFCVLVVFTQTTHVMCTSVRIDNFLFITSQLTVALCPMDALKWPMVWEIAPHMHNTQKLILLFFIDKIRMVLEYSVNFPHMQFYNEARPIEFYARTDGVNFFSVVVTPSKQKVYPEIDWR